MKSEVTRIGLTTIISALLISTSAFAGQGIAQDAVTSKGEHPVVSTDGSCVRTKWQSGNDVCATQKTIKIVKAPAEKIELEQRTIYFDFNKSLLTPTEIIKLDKLVDIVSHSKSITHATVLGYTDDIGTNSYNLKLSQKRAETVEKYLGSRVTIPTNVLMVSGQGEANPVATCSPKMKRKQRIACLAQNRRVEIQFDYME